MRAADVNERSRGLAEREKALCLIVQTVQSRRRFDARCRYLAAGCAANERVAKQLPLRARRQEWATR